MDSFEWFGEIGNQPYDSLKPPGDIFHEVFNTATMGLESFGGGGGGKSKGKDFSKKVHKYNKKKQNHDHEINIEQWEHNNEINKLKREQEEEVWQFKTKDRAQSYQHSLDMREFSHNEKIRGRENVIHHINRQLDYFDIARGKAHEQAAQVASERRTKLALSARTSSTEYQKNVEGLQLKADQSRLAYETRMKGLNLEAAGTHVSHMVKTRDLQNKKTAATVQHQAQAAELAFKQVSGQREMVKARGKARATGQVGQSAAATDRDILAAFQQKDAQILYMTKNGDLQQQIQQYGINNAMIGLAGHRLYEKGKQALEWESSKEARKLQIKGQATEQKYLNLFRDIRLEEERQTGLSITAAYDRMIDDVDMKWEGSKIAAEAKIPLLPNLGPAPPPPLPLPKATKWINPPKPRKGPTPVRGGSYSASPQVQGSTTGSILSGVSAGATALGAFGSMAASGGGAIGLGGLGTIGLGAMGPIGLGIGLIAGVGSIFNWW